MGNKIDSNLTGLRIAEEEEVGVLPAAPVWKPHEPNSYGDFGAQISTLARAPITAGRQRKKGVVVDLDASAGFQADFTQKSFYDLLQGFMFADWRAKPLSDATAAVDGGAGEDSYTVDSGGAEFLPNDLIYASGFSSASNNGIKVGGTTASTATSVYVAGTLAPETGASGSVRHIGHQFASGDATIVVTDGEPGLETTTKDLTQLGLIPGEWVWIGGDAAGTAFDTAANNGWARIKSIAVNRMAFDKTLGTMAGDTAGTKTIRIFIGDAIKNESDPSLIKVRTYQQERSLSTAGFEYVLGCYANQLQLNFSTADKVTADLSFVATDSEQRAAGSEKSGSRPALEEADALNTTSDVARLRLAKVGSTSPLAAYFDQVTLTINNNVSPLKAIAVLGAFDSTVGDFQVSGQLEAFFSSIDAVQAVRDNADVTLDFALVKNNSGWVFDVPLVSLGDARLNVTKDQPIKLPLTTDAAADPDLDHTLLLNCFHYLPDAADL